MTPNDAGSEMLNAEPGTNVTRLNRLKNSPRSVKLTCSVIAVRLLKVKSSPNRGSLRTPGSAIGAVPKLKFGGLLNPAGLRKRSVLGSNSPLYPLSGCPGTRLVRRQLYQSSLP